MKGTYERPAYGHVDVRARRLPHWTADYACLFLTWNLFDAIPRALRLEMEERKDALRLRARMSPREREDLRRLERQVQDALDRGYGSCLLRDPRVACVVSDALKFFHGKRYWLVAWCVMPNHVHTVIQLWRSGDLGKILHSWKSYSANEANRILDRVGKFWQREGYDRLIRDTAELERRVRYTLENPARAGLGSWPWVGLDEEWLGRLMGRVR